ncbi:MAG TPA: hypothetical protein PKM73_08670, partial [Verrucomicrobiota bacterium]|nr:hypothetical protein [Verrucomicrobiota bacterium]HNU52441.1 hypothetical protein [Verrucomicrobiota bacterium]
PEKIGAFGFSAGSHLTVLFATSALTPAYGPVDTLDGLPCHVNWAVAIYPAYALTDGADKPNAQGGNEDDARLVPEFSFDLATCPILFLHGDADGWAAMNSVKCWEQLRRSCAQNGLEGGHSLQQGRSEGQSAWNRRVHRPSRGQLAVERRARRTRGATAPPRLVGHRLRMTPRCHSGSFCCRAQNRRRIHLFPIHRKASDGPYGIYDLMPNAMDHFGIWAIERRPTAGSDPRDATTEV